MKAGKRAGECKCLEQCSFCFFFILASFCKPTP